MSNKNKRVWGFLGKESPCIPMLVTQIDGKFRVTVESTGKERVSWCSYYLESEALNKADECSESDEDPEYIKSWWRLLFDTKAIALQFRSTEIARCVKKYELRIEVSLDQIKEDQEAIFNLKRMELIL